MPGSKRLIIAFFENPAAAEVAARAMERRLAVTERHVDAVVGLLSLDPSGRVITAKLGRRAGEDGPGVGAVLGFIALAMTATTLPASGELLDARSELSTDDVARFGAALDSGLAAVAVLEPQERSERAVLHLAELGGKVELHRLTERGILQAASATGS
jgi:hypothetical protein